MNLSQLEDFLQTQEMAFTSILKATKNLDPAELKKSLMNHHARMIVIAGGQYPINALADLKSPTPSPVIPPSSSKRPRPDETDSTDEYYTPTKPKVSYSSKSTPKSRSSSGIRASDLSGRLRTAGAGNLFKSRPSYTVSPSGFKNYSVIELSSDEGSDSEFAEAKENPNFEGSDSEICKKMFPVRKGVAVRKVTPAKKNAAAPKKVLSKFSDESDESDIETGKFSKRKGKSNGSQWSGKSSSKTSKAAGEVDVEVLNIKKDIARLEDSLKEKQAELGRISNVLARQPVLDIVRELRQTIESKKALLSKDCKSLRSVSNSGLERSSDSKAKSMASTVEDAPESDEDTLFRSQESAKDSASKRRRI